MHLESFLRAKTFLPLGEQSTFILLPFLYLTDKLFFSFRKRSLCVFIWSVKLDIKFHLEKAIFIQVFRNELCISVNCN